jgi:hypothetical protein
MKHTHCSEHSKTYKHFEHYVLSTPHGSSQRRYERPEHDNFRGEDENKEVPLHQVDPNGSAACIFVQKPAIIPCEGGLSQAFSQAENSSVTADIRATASLGANVTLCGSASHS